MVSVVCINVICSTVSVYYHEVKKMYTEIESAAYLSCWLGTWTLFFEMEQTTVHVFVTLILFKYTRYGFTVFLLASEAPYVPNLARQCLLAGWHLSKSCLCHLSLATPVGINNLPVSLPMFGLTQCVFVVFVLTVLLWSIHTFNKV